MLRLFIIWYGEAIGTIFREIRAGLITVFSTEVFSY